MLHYSKTLDFKSFKGIKFFKKLHTSKEYTVVGKLV